MAKWTVQQVALGGLMAAGLLVGGMSLPSTTAAQGIPQQCQVVVCQPVQTTPTPTRTGAPIEIRPLPSINEPFAAMCSGQGGVVRQGSGGRLYCAK